MRHYLAILLITAALTACSEMPSWMGGKPPVVKRAPGERVDVLGNPGVLKPDESVQDVAIDVPDQVNLEQWRSLNEAMLTAHVGLTGVTKEQSARVGDGNRFSRGVVSAPVVAGGMVYAMDAAGIISAHDESDISTVKWMDKTGRSKRISDVFGGGLTVEDGVLYATTGMGNVRALDAATGALKWSIRAGAPVRGAPAVANGIIVVLTADNQTLAYNASDGQPRWNHRAIRDAAGYYSATAPVISEGIVIAAYSSGEVFALRLETGSVLWNDALVSSDRTKASAALAGIDANPIVQEGVVVIASASGEMQASALLNGRPLWRASIGTHNTPWSAGNALYVISDGHDVAAVLKRDGSIRWATSMAVKDENDPTKDKTPPLYGPILSANAVLVIDAKGVLTSFKPTTGEKIGSFDLADDVVTNPIVAGGALYVMTKDAKLWRYY